MFGVERLMKHKQKSLNKNLCFNFLKKPKLIHKTSFRNSIISITIKLVVYQHYLQRYFFKRKSH